MEDKNPYHGYTELEIDDLANLSVADIGALTSTPMPSISLGHGHGFSHSGIGYSTPGFSYNPGQWTISNDYTSRTHDIQLEDGADIKLGDVSLKQTLKEIADRLAILVPDVKLEREYEELRQAREHYEHVKQKLTMLEKLKNTPVELPK
jgi:hypothetical protein